MVPDIRFGQKQALPLPYIARVQTRVRFGKKWDQLSDSLKKCVRFGTKKLPGIRFGKKTGATPTVARV